MQTVIIVIHLLIVLAMIGLVLLQTSEGGGLGMGGGGGFMSTRGTANLLTRSTALSGRRVFRDQPVAVDGWPAITASRPRSSIPAHRRARACRARIAHGSAGLRFRRRARSAADGPQRPAQPAGPAGPAVAVTPQDKGRETGPCESFEGQLSQSLRGSSPSSNRVRVSKG